MWKSQRPDLTLLIPELEQEPPAPCSWPPGPPAPCSCCDKEPSKQSTSSSLNWKLVLLLTIALGALASILVISHQLISRHLVSVGGEMDGVTLSLTIPESGWRSNEGLHQALRHPSFDSSDYQTIVHSLEEQKEEREEEQEEQEYSLRPHGEELKLEFHSPLSLLNTGGVPLVTDGMYWSKEVEAVLPPGLEESSVQMELAALRGRKVASLEEPSWLRCGREQNRFVTFQDGVTACARYREPHTQLVLGELASFYLARLLGITNVPAVVLSQVDPNSPVWSSALSDISSSSWRLGSVVALSQWRHGLERVAMPDIVRQALLARTTVDVTSDTEQYSDMARDLGHADLRELSLVSAASVAQWSDLVVLDYLTGNYDRVSSMQDAAEKERRPSLLSETVHNLARDKETGGLWLLDNESGLLDAYSLLYPTPAMGPAAEREARRFRSMQRDLLQTTCIFRRQTVDRVFSLYKAGDAAGLLDSFVSRAEPLYRELLEGLPEQEEAFRGHFQERLEEVWTWMKQCQENVKFW